MKLDRTHDPELESWVESANAEGCEFPIQNLPFGIFHRKGRREPPRAGVAIGNEVLDLVAFAHAAGFKGKALAAAKAASGPALNGLAALGRPAWHALRQALSRALARERGWEERKRRLSRHLVPMAKVQLLLPVAIGDFTDGYTSLFHATNIGRMLRPDNPLAQAPYLAAPFSLSTPSGVAALNAEVTRQAAMIAYIDDFALMMLVVLLSMPLLLMVRGPRPRPSPAE